MASLTSWQARRRYWSQYPWWVRFCVFWTLGSIIGGCIVIFSSYAYGAEPSAHHVRPHSCVLPDPDRPCWANPDQMSYWFYHGHQHGFKQLDSRYTFPQAFIKVAVSSHQAWCKDHPAQCKMLMEQLAPYRTDGDCGWWCQYRNSLDGDGCAGGWSIEVWECESGYVQQGELDGELSKTDSIVWGCAGSVAISFAIAGPDPIGLVGAGSGCAWSIFLGSFEHVPHGVTT